ncbi:hypothetical protein BCY91_14115 [Pelobium manganitolerans]|uniref:Uncharacterized protein n=1 Tax=Pelobium manganitolerans TaxID=1842495 RepID=A0A419SAB9_9SPHI|nr:hypothetical protein [Pelobium manganitolerans]RKD19008.1 hypothetical protein BCY91_14115 [Pelobium manganitolerans]
MGQLYINDVLMDMSAKTIIGVTKQISDVGDIDKVKGNTTNQFKLPLTKKNIEALGIPGDLNFSKGMEYRLLRAKYIENGLEVIPYGFASIEAVNEFIEVRVISGNIEFFDLLTGNIKELFSPEFETQHGLPSLNHYWDIASIIYSLGNTTGYIYPLVDYGNLTADTLLRCEEMRPAVFVSAVMERIFIKTGFKFEGDVFQDPEYLAEILPFSGDKMEQAPGSSDFALRATKLSTQNGDSGPWFQVSIPDAGTSNASGRWQNNRYTFLKSGTVKFKVKAIVSGSNNVEKMFTIGLQRNEDEYVGVFLGTKKMFAFGQASVSDYVKKTIEFETEELAFNAGDYVRMYANRNTTSGPFPSRSSYVYPETYIEVIPGAALYKSMIDIRSVLPDDDIKTFLKNFMFRFGLVVQTDNIRKTVSFRPFSDIKKNKMIAVDWTDKVDQSLPANREFKIGSYGQRNYFVYKEDQSVSKELGKGIISIADESLPVEKTVITSLYAASETVYRAGGLPAVFINKITESDKLDGKKDFTVNTAQRIARIYRTNARVEFAEGDYRREVDRYDFPATYFNMPDIGLGFDKILEKRYRELVEVLTLTKKVTENIRLNEVDISEFDFFTPVYLGKYAMYFYVNKISNYVDGQKTKVELIRL